MEEAWRVETHRKKEVSRKGIQGKQCTGKKENRRRRCAGKGWLKEQEKRRN